MSDKQKSNGIVSEGTEVLQLQIEQNVCGDFITSFLWVENNDSIGRNESSCERSEFSSPHFLGPTNLRQWDTIMTVSLDGNTFPLIVATGKPHLKHFRSVSYPVIESKRRPKIEAGFCPPQSLQLCSSFHAVLIKPRLPPQ